MLDQEIGTISVVDPVSFTIVDAIRVGDDEIDMVFGAGALWLADGLAGSVTRVDALTHEVASFPVDGIVLSVAADPRTGEIWTFVARGFGDDG